jgi:predicted transcriptional regulator
MKISRTYDDGVRVAIKEQVTKDLENVASRIEILEEELHEARKEKWNAVRKLKLLDDHNGPAHDLRHCLQILDEGEALTLHDKIKMIKDGFADDLSDLEKRYRCV